MENIPFLYPPLRSMSPIFEKAAELQANAEAKAKEYLTARNGGGGYYASNVKIDFKSRRVTFVARPSSSGMGEQLSFDAAYLENTLVNGVSLEGVGASEKKAKVNARNELEKEKEELAQTPQVKRWLELQTELYQFGNNFVLPQYSGGVYPLCFQIP